MDYKKELLEIETELRELSLSLETDNNEEIMKFDSLEIERKELMQELNIAILSSRKFDLLKEMDKIEEEQKRLQDSWAKRKEDLQNKISALNKRKYKLEEQKYLEITRKRNEEIKKINNQKEESKKSQQELRQTNESCNFNYKPDLSIDETKEGLEKTDNLSVTNMKQFKSELAVIKKYLQLTINTVIALEEKISQEQIDEKEIEVELELENLRKQL